MTIYSQISYNKWRTVLLMFLFIAFFSFVFWLIGKFSGDTPTYFLLGFVISILSAIGSYFYSDKIILFMHGAKPANQKDYFDFYTVSQNLAIASGLPMPKLYVINDSALNAFATGRDPKHAVICATSGLLQKMNRAELEGVIAHEFSHVKNYDILLSSLIAVLVGTLAFTTDWIMRSWWWSRSDDEDRANPLVFLFFIFILVLSPVVATLIQLAVSRKREFLADATGALLTRNPDALASALEKISSNPQILKSASGATAHLFIENPFKKEKRMSKWFSTLFSTHPSVEERIKILHAM